MTQMNVPHTLLWNLLTWRSSNLDANYLCSINTQTCLVWLPMATASKIFHGQWARWIPINLQFKCSCDSCRPLILIAYIYMPFYWCPTRKIQLGHKIKHNSIALFLIIHYFQMNTCSSFVCYAILLVKHWLNLEEGLGRHEGIARRNTNLYRNVNLHLRNIYADTYIRNKLFVLVPVEIATGQGKESMPCQASYLAP